MKLILFSPELYFFMMVVLMLCLSLVKRSSAGRDYLAALTLAALGVVVTIASVRLEGILFVGVYRVDLYSQVFKVMLSLGLFLIICICSELKGIEQRHHPEFYALLFTSTLAMMLLISSVHILSIYLALELSSYSLYILVSLRKGRSTGIEAGLKYFLVGVTASAVMLFGLALLYGTTGETYIQGFVRVLPDMIDRPAVIIGLLLTLCGFFFKLAVFPFHLWAPDVYQGAAT